MENDAPVVGPDVPTASSKMVKLDIAAAGLLHESALERVAHGLDTHLVAKDLWLSQVPRYSGSRTHLESAVVSVENRLILCAAPEV